MNNRWANTLVPPRPELNKVITFSKYGIGSRYLKGIGTYEVMGWGWSYPEDWGVWAMGSEAVINFPLPKIRPQRLILEVAFPTQLRGEIPVEVYINNELDRIIPGNSNKIPLEINIPEINPSKPNLSYNLSIKFIPIILKTIKDSSNVGDTRPIFIGIISAKFSD